MLPLVILLVFFAVLALLLAWKLRQARRAEFIRHQPFPKGLYAALKREHPAFGDKECQLVGLALRQFFGAWNRGGFAPMLAPSVAVVSLWRALAADAPAWARWQAQAFGGRDFPPTAACGLRAGERGPNTQLRRCWWQACRLENIHPWKPTRLPLLFALDAKLGVAGGIAWSLPGRWEAQRRSSDSGGGVTYSASFSTDDLTDTTFDGTTDGMGEGDGAGGTSGDSGGDGGGGDGGGGE